MKTFYIVATPIGNLEDIGMRALRILREVPVIVCERPQHTLKLLNHFGISGKQLVAYTEANRARAIGTVLELMRGKSCAFVVDAGTPGISDPGPELIAAVRDAGVPIEMIPGPNALAAAIALTGERIVDFRFVGFFPYKQKDRMAMLDALQGADSWLIAYEAPHRIEKTIKFLSERYPRYHIVLVSEISKVYEKVLAGTSQELLESFQRNSRLRKGEFVMCVRAKGESQVLSDTH